MYFDSELLSADVCVCVIWRNGVDRVPRRDRPFARLESTASRRELRDRRTNARREANGIIIWPFTVPFPTKFLRLWRVRRQRRAKTFSSVYAHILALTAVRYVKKALRDADWKDLETRKCTSLTMICQVWLLGTNFSKLLIPLLYLAWCVLRTIIKWPCEF